jgi:hypothetical protein
MYTPLDTVYILFEAFLYVLKWENWGRRVRWDILYIHDVTALTFVVKFDPHSLNLV